MSAEKNEDRVSLRGHTKAPEGHSRVSVHTYTHNYTHTHTHIHLSALLGLGAAEIQTTAAQSWLKHLCDSREAEFYNTDVRERRG